MAADAEWLQAVYALLAPLAPRGLVLVSGDERAEERVWLDDVAVSPCGARHPPSFDARGPGWLLRLPGSGEERRGLLVALDPPALEDEPGALLATTMIRLSWRMRRHRSGLASTLARSETDEVMHALRNGINSVLMVSAVLASAAVPEALRPFVGDLQSAGRRSQTSLAELAQLLEQG